MWLFSIFVIHMALSMAGPRVSGIHKDLSVADMIFMKRGLVTVIEFPAPILEVRAGNQHVIKAQLSGVSVNEITVSLDSDSMGATNLIVRAQGKVYVFDIIPSKTSHQDYVKVLSGYGSVQSSKSPQVTSSGSFGLEPAKNSSQLKSILEKEEL